MNFFKLEGHQEGGDWESVVGRHRSSVPFSMKFFASLFWGKRGSDEEGKDEELQLWCVLCPPQREEQREEEKREEVGGREQDQEKRSLHGNGVGW